MLEKKNVCTKVKMQMEKMKMVTIKFFERKKKICSYQFNI